MQTPKNTLRQRDFIIVLLGQIISLFGNAILRFALPLHLLRATGSAALFGGVSALSFAPMIVLSLLGGVLADRASKRKIMVAMDFGVALLCALFLLLMDGLPVAAATAAFLMLLYGASGLYQPAVQASMPALLRGEALLRGNAAVNMVSTLDDLLGPALGGALFGLFGLRPVLAVSAVCFFFSAVMELFLRIPQEKRTRSENALVTAGRDLAESWRYIRRAQPSLLRLTALLALFNFALSAALVVGVPVLAVDLLRLTDGAVGVTQAAMGLGGLCGGLLAGVWAGRLRLRHGFFRPARLRARHAACERRRSARRSRMAAAVGRLLLRHDRRLAVYRARQRRRAGTNAIAPGRQGDGAHAGGRHVRAASGAGALRGAV